VNKKQWLKAAQLVALLLLLGQGGCSTERAIRASSTEPPKPYLRVQRPDEDSIELQVALRQFLPAERRGPAIWLVAASHLGEPQYYKQLQEHLNAQTYVLYEGVGGKPSKAGSSIGGLQANLAHSLGLVFQLEAIDYERPNFTNSDLTLEQLAQLLRSQQPGSGAAGAENQLGQLLSVMDGSSIVGALLNLALKFIGSSPYLQGMTKLMFIEILGEVKGDLSEAGGLPPDIKHLVDALIKARNQVVIDDLKKVVRKRSSKASVAVFYGAGHMYDLEKKLQTELGYRPARDVWLTAFGVKLSRAGLSESDVDMVRTLVRWQMKQLEMK